MKKVEAKELLIKHLMPFLEPHGFKYKIKNSSDFQILRTTKSGFDKISGGINDYNTTQQIVYGFGKINQEVQNVVSKFNGYFSNSNLKNIKPNTSYIGFSYKSLNGFFDHRTDMPFMETENDVINAVDLIKKFNEDYSFELFEKFENINEVDKIINGENPWVDDWQREYSLAGSFSLMRLIIAKLCKNKNYNELIDFNFKAYEKLLSDNDGVPFVYDRKDFTKPLPALIKMLDDL